MRSYERGNKFFWELECFFRWLEKYSSRMVTLGRTFVPVKSPHFSRERGTLCEFCGLNKMLSQLCSWATEMNWISHKAKQNKSPPGPGLQMLMFVNTLLLTFIYQNWVFVNDFALWNRITSSLFVSGAYLPPLSDEDELDNSSLA